MKDSLQFLEKLLYQFWGGKKSPMVQLLNPILFQFVNYVLSGLGVWLKTSGPALQMSCQIIITVLAMQILLCLLPSDKYDTEHGEKIQFKLLDKQH